MTRRLNPLAAAAALISSHAPLAQGAPVSQMHAYEGPRRPAAQLATVYGAIRLNRLDRTMICEVDGKSVRTFSGCRSIVYLLPGSHRLPISYFFCALSKAKRKLTAHFAAGRGEHNESRPAWNLGSVPLSGKTAGSP